MINIHQKLNKISIQLLMDIESSYYSIYKINQSDSIFKDLQTKIDELKNAVYILNPNYNDADGNLFLNNVGETVYKADFFSNLITHDDLDFEYETKSYWKKSPLEKILNSEDLVF